MSGTKRAAPVLQHQDGQVENGTERKTAHASTQNDTTFRGGGQIQIADLLLCGQENAVSLRHLEQITGFPNRYLRRRIQEERLSGIPILSDNVSGYYLPANDQERRRFVRSMRSRAKEIEATAAAVERGQPNE